MALLAAWNNVSFLNVELLKGLLSFCLDVLYRVCFRDDYLMQVVGHHYASVSGQRSVLMAQILRELSVYYMEGPRSTLRG